jgi:hypothetical protein
MMGEKRLEVLLERRDDDIMALQGKQTYLELYVPLVRESEQHQ